MSSSVICIESDDEEVIVISSQNPANTSDVIIVEEGNRNGTSSTVQEVINLDDAEPGPSKVTETVPSSSTVTSSTISSSSSSTTTPTTTTTTPVKRIKPTLLSHEVTSPSKKKLFGAQESSKPLKRKSKTSIKGGAFKRNSLVKLSDNLTVTDEEEEENHKSEEEGPPKQKNIKLEVNQETSEVKAPVTEEKITKEFRKLILACREVDTSSDMEKLIRKKLIGYYREVPQEFVTAKSFRDLVTSVTEEIKKSPHLIYLKITRIIEELKPRRRTVLLVKQEKQDGGGNGEPVDAEVAVQMEMNKKKALQIKKLNKALAQLKKRIDELDKEEVDFDEDVNSAHMKVERYKKRACQIYEKLCDLSGESKHAQRSVRKPIKFHGTVYPEFNKTLQAFVNRTNIFPDYFDVKKCLEHCNQQYNMRLRVEEVKAIAQDAFVKVGKILQKRRKIDLYEMISYFAGTEADPADEDADLQDKLGRNKQHHSKISDLIDKFADEQGQNGHDDDQEEDPNKDGDKDSEELDIKFDPTSLLEANMSVDEDDKDVKNNSIDLFAEDDNNFETDTEETSKSDEIDIIDSLPVNGDDNQLPNATSTQLIPSSVTPPAAADKDESNSVEKSKEAENANTTTTTTANTTNNNIKPQQDQLLEDSVNMDEAIQYMVTNSMDPFADVDEMLLEDIPM